MSHPIIRVAIADDHPVIRMGIEAAIDEIPTLSCIGAVGDSSALVALLEQSACDVVVTDYAMPAAPSVTGCSCWTICARIFRTCA